jgi:hypothetical protein
MTEEMRLKIEEGYRKMKELDDMIKSKAKVWGFMQVISNA